MRERASFPIKFVANSFTCPRVKLKGRGTESSREIERENEREIERETERGLERETGSLREKLGRLERETERGFEREHERGIENDTMKLLKIRRKKLGSWCCSRKCVQGCLALCMTATCPKLTSTSLVTWR